MQVRKRRSILPGLMLLIGIVGMELRILLRQQVDQRWLLPAGHPAGIALGVLTAAALVLAFCYARKLGSSEETAFPGSRAVFWGHVLAGTGILLTLLGSSSQIQSKLDLVWKVLAGASIPCLLAAGWYRRQGKQPFFALHLCPTVFLVVYTVGQYQYWSSDPQLLNYIFPLLGIICMVFFAFYHSAFDIGLRWRRRLTFFGLASICLGITSLPGCGDPWLYLGMALWALLDNPARKEN